MMGTMTVLLLSTLLSWVGLVHGSCSSDQLVVYRMRLHTFWDEETFPKQYPEWRPPAQWSKTIGFSHVPGWKLFRLGEEVTEGVKQFTETGETDVLDRENVTNKFLDVFTAPPVETGAGIAETVIFVDGNHSKVSLLTKIVPSPDWFIGLDNLELCQNGQFIDTLSIKADPLDAGTDNGFTFTSPNWPTVPQGVVFRITNNYPPHPAGSFHYPHLHKLPTIAIFSFHKDKEYELKEEFHTENHRENVVLNSQVNKFSYEVVGNSVTETSTNVAEIVDFVPVEETTKHFFNEAKNDHAIMTNEIPNNGVRTGKTARVGLKGAGGKTSGFRSASSLGGYHASTSPKDFFKKKYVSHHLSQVDKIVFPSKTSQTSKKSQLYKQILDAYNKKGGISPSLAKEIKKYKKYKMRRFRKRKDSRHSKQKKPKDCRVSKWGSWGQCSKTCGIGESVRVRSVTRHPRHGGKPCPALKDYKWCGSARNCKSGYFSW